MGAPQKLEAATQEPTLHAVQTEDIPPAAVLREYFLSFRHDTTLVEAVGSVATDYVEYRAGAIAADTEAKITLSRREYKEYVEFDRSAAARRRDVTVRIFRELGMLEAGNEPAIATGYEKIESDLANGQVDIDSAKDTVVAYFEHPALRASRELVGRDGLQFSRDDAIISQRTIAQLLAQAGFSPEPMKDD